MLRLLLTFTFLSLLLVSHFGETTVVDQEKELANSQQSYDCLNLMPCPKQITQRDGQFTLSKSPRLYISGMSDSRERFVLKHMSRQLTNLVHYQFNGFTMVDDNVSADIKVIVSSKPHSKEAAVLPRFGDDESYLLSITEQGITIHADNDFGALHGLTSLTQLIGMSGQPSNKLNLPLLEINDQPRFKWRGLLIDSVRHFIPVSVIKRQLDGMAAAKLNVFHWHLTDDQGWRVESTTHPKLHQMASDGLYYTQAQIADVVTYASNLGIRVVPEIDLPGHASAIAVAYPELMAEQKSYVMQRHWGVFEPLLDVTNPSVYTFINSLVAELTRLFPDEYFHIGGDEVNPKQWLNNESIKELMANNGMKDASDVHNFFNVKLQGILAQYNRKMMGWDEVLHDELSKNIVVQSWRGLQSLNVIAGKGYQALLSAGYYIDQPQPTSYHYRNEPLANLALETEQVNQEQRVKAKPDEAWHTWAFEMPRHKGSAVRGSLTLINDKKPGKLSGYVKLNDHYHQKINMQSTAADFKLNKAVFSLDSWMGPLVFEVTIPKKGKLGGFTLVGNSYYALVGKSLASEQTSFIALQPKLAIAQSKNILGGEATLWSEMVNEQNIDLRTWPRLFAIAERFWSPQSVNDINYMYQRLITVNDYAANIIGLKHQQQQLSGFSSFVSDSPERQHNIDALVTFSQMLEPAHYYTRHHLKYQKNQYHQNARLDNFVDYLPVESFTVLAMKNSLTRFNQSEESALLDIKQQLITWRKSMQTMTSIIAKNTQLSSLKNTLAKTQQANNLGLEIVSRCIERDLFNHQEALMLDKQLLALQNDTGEIVVVTLPLIRSLLNSCQASIVQ